MDFAFKYPLAATSYSFSIIWFILAALSAYKDIQVILFRRRRFKEIEKAKAEAEKNID